MTCGENGYWCHGTCKRNGRCMYLKPIPTNWNCSACQSKVYKGHRFPQNCMHPDGPCPETP